MPCINFLLYRFPLFQQRFILRRQIGYKFSKISPKTLTVKSSTRKRFQIDEIIEHFCNVESSRLHITDSFQFLPFTSIYNSHSITSLA